MLPKEDRLTLRADRKHHIQEEKFMSADDQSRITNIKINSQNLYKEESFTDLTNATIRRLTPVKSDGTIDESREAIFAGMTQLTSPNGPIPVHCIIEGAKNLDDAAAKLPEAVEKAVQAMIEEAKKMEREEASRLVVPGR